jgi:hypothetical protein
MKVKVQKTCELDEVSSIVIDTLVRVQGELGMLSNQKFNYWQVSELLSQIDSLRGSLTNIDHALDDAASIASGWLEAVIREAQPPGSEPGPTEEEQEETIDEEKEEI